MSLLKRRVVHALAFWTVMILIGVTVVSGSWLIALVVLLVIAVVAFVMVAMVATITYLEYGDLAFWRDPR